MTIIPSVNSSVLNFLAIETYEFTIPESELGLIFSSDQQIAQKSTSVFLGCVNRALRQHCIHTSEYITMMKQYGFIPAILSAWDRFSNSLNLLGEEISEIFEQNTVHAVTTPPGAIKQAMNIQILNFGYKNWQKYVLAQRFIGEELPSTIQLIGEDPAKYPFHNIQFTDHSLRLLKLLPDNNISERECFLALLIAKFMHLFVKHKALYPDFIKFELKECAMIADTLYACMRYNTDMYINTRNALMKKVSDLRVSLKGFEPQIPQNFSLFDNHEYISLLKMVCLCNPEEYINKIIPGQINHFPTQKFSNSSSLETVYPFYERNVLPLYERALSIIEGNPDAVRKLSELLCKKLFPMEAFMNDSTMLFGKLEQYLHCVWRITNCLPQYVITLSNSFITYYKAILNTDIKNHKDEEVQETVAKINGLVDGEFNHHPTMILARSTLLIPHQKDTELVGRARVLVEKAHNPSKKNFSIAELFDIVPFVKNRRDLFKGIADFVQSQLLSQADPSVELERSLIDSMGQYTESEYIAPLQIMLKEFAERYDDFKKIGKKSTIFPKELKIAVLSNLRWKQIVQRGKLPFFDTFEIYRDKFEEKYKGMKQNSSLVWCDPASVVEVKLWINGRYLLFLFNGVQYGIIRLLIEHQTCAFSGMVKYIIVDDLKEQLSTLVDTGLVKNYPNDKEMYYLSQTIDPKMNRNFAKKFTSAENIAILQMKEFDRRKVVSSMIVKTVKLAGNNGIKMKDLVKEVQKISLKYFSINQEVIREQTRELEITKYIQLKKNSAVDLFEFVP